MSRAVLRRPGAAEALFAAALGALQTVAFVHTALWWLVPVCVALLVWRLNAASPRRAALLGGLYGTGWLGTGVWWLFISLHRYGGLPAALAALAVLALAVALALFVAAACAAYARWRRAKAVPDALLFGALWLLAELARGMLLTGFPWLASGYSQVDAPLAVLAPWVGVYGIGAVLAFAGAVLGNLGQVKPGRRGLTGAAVAAGIVLPGLAGPAEFTSSTGTMSVTLVQTNVAQDEKFAAERMPAALAWLSQALHNARGALVVAPETAVPLLPGQLEEFAPGWWDALQGRFKDSTQAALLGLPLGDFDRGYTNSVAGLSAAPGAMYRYDKVHLVPFGEFIPAGLRWFTEALNIPLGDFARGPAQAPSFAVGAQRVAPNVCFEDLFGEELAVRFRDPARAPTLLANLSNIGWFGDTVVLPQHLAITRLRTLELQRPMLRATNTGVTAIVDHRGRVTHRLPPFTRGVLDGEVEGRSGITPFAWWAARFGLWPLVGLALGVLAALAALARSRLRRAP